MGRCDTTPVKLWALVGDGGEIELQLVYFDSEVRALTYVIRSGPLPFKNYVGDVKVSENGRGKAQLSWQGHYTASGVPQEKADEILGGFYEAIAGRIGESYERVR